MAASKRKRRSPNYTAPGRKGEGRRPEPVTAARPSRRESRERPPAPWGRFPLVELVVLIGLVLLIVGFVIGESRGAVMIACGLTLASLAGLELSIREHLAGFRSHSTVLAGFVTVLGLAAGYFLLPSDLFGLNLLIGVVVFGISFYAFRELFKRRSGGVGFR
jgi:hypothetical protein